MDSNGKVTAVSAGTAVITVTTADGNKTATCTVTVKERTVSVTGVSLNKTSLTLTEGQSETLTATVSPSNATNKDVRWSSGNTDVATVNNGTVTAVSTGSAVITVITADGKFTDTCTVHVVEVSITEQPEDVSVKAGETAHFHVAASGEGLTYQWQLSRDNGINWASMNGRKFPSALTSTFEIKGSKTNNGNLFRCIVSDKNGDSLTSESAKLTLEAPAPLEISSHPVDTSVIVGEEAQFHVAAIGEGVRYQWQISRDNGINWVNLNGKKFPSALTSDLKIVGRKSNNGNLFRCVVKDKYGQKINSGSAKLTLETSTALSITFHPVDTSVKSGKSAQFHVVAAGDGLHYQWQISRDNGLNWANLSKTKFPSALSADFEIKASKSVNGYLFRCVVSDQSGESVTSESAKLTLETASGPEITSQPSDVTVSIGEKAQFHVTATGTGLKYRWQLTRDNGLNWVNLNGTKFPSALTADFEIKGSKTNNNNLFRCVVSDALGNQAVSQKAKISLK